jgi:hypothetical protein
MFRVCSRMARQVCYHIYFMIKLKKHRQTLVFFILKTRMRFTCPRAHCACGAGQIFTTFLMLMEILGGGKISV